MGYLQNNFCSHQVNSGKNREIQLSKSTNNHSSSFGLIEAIMELFPIY